MGFFVGMGIRPDGEGEGTVLRANRVIQKNTEGCFPENGEKGNSENREPCLLPFPIYLLRFPLIVGGDTGEGVKSEA
jgi:hypothetical protein